MRRLYTTGCIASATHMCGMEDVRTLRFPAQEAAAGVSRITVPAQGSAPAPAGGSLAAGQPAPAPVVDVVTVIQQAVANVQLPEPVLHLGPEPTDNEWKMLAVGLPVWFWTDQNAAVDGTTTQQGITVRLAARPVETTIDTGDGESVTCTSSTPRPAGEQAMKPSPDCGHTWLKPGNHRVTATAVWQVDWEVLGASGSVMMDRNTTRSVEVGELVSVVVK